MICSTCHKPARDNAVAYYTVEAQDRFGMQCFTLKCWTCLTPAEKSERDPGYSNRVRFELIKSLRTR